MSVEVKRRITKQRKLVLETLRANPVHPTAEYIYNQLKIDHPGISLGTVYRNLNVLYELGEISIVPGNFQCDHFDGVAEPHYHFICNKCGQIFDLDMPYIPSIDSVAQDTSNFTIDSHNIIFSGCCKDCKE